MSVCIAIPLEKRIVLKARRATQLIFLLCGLGVASWAPMVPYAKERLAMNEASLGLLLLLLGGGALIMMPITGFLIHRYGSRIIILLSALMIALLLPLLLMMGQPVSLGITLFFFGAGVGAVDVAMNAHAVHVQEVYGRHIMSSFHGLFSVGGLFGSLGLGALMKLGLEPIAAAVTIAILLIIIVCSQYKDLFSVSTETALTAPIGKTAGNSKIGGALWLNHGVLFLGAMCFIVFLAEGAMLDWSAVFLREERSVDAEWSGVGYAAFSIAMAFMRLAGDRLVEHFSPNKTVVLGSFVAGIGFLLAVLSPWTFASIFGFILLGLGAANVVPVFFSAAGRMPGIPASVAIPAITTMGYAGQLAGPALLGFVAFQFSLPIAFALVALLLFVVSLSYLKRK
ncbi:MFS transporter [Olivibacter sp. SDN3]|uniref:MFS transporter n=1 Tax=Olivibacter sp. SDN3 TaxID=2764720 RepID=UPI0016513B25|nr:MFS transporter [Olivibacter sp. SDN3]QNL48397.1 MFS transporter [Olivibacter sp. SDN3]